MDENRVRALPHRPRIKPEHQPYRTTDGRIRLGSGLFGIAAEINDPSGRVWELLEAMNGLRTISEMNHHIRNSLQVITYATATQRDSESVEMIRSSVERIEWALREVLPHEIEGPIAPPQSQQHQESLNVR